MRQQLRAYLRGGVAILIATATIIVPVTAANSNEHPGIAQVRRATAPYHDLAVAGDDEYVAFLPCIDHPAAGGMGQHYVNFSILDGEVDALAPEALVYEVRGDQYKLVAVEYVVPQSEWSDPNPPVLFGKEFGRNDDLGIFALHAWIWRPNPVDMFEDFNLAVRACP
ncbi:MAG TPA: hypothetical protein VGB52_00175 [Actinomycetota bacterium]